MTALNGLRVALRTYENVSAENKAYAAELLAARARDFLREADQPVVDSGWTGAVVRIPDLPQP